MSKSSRKVIRDVPKPVLTLQLIVNPSIPTPCHPGTEAIALKRRAQFKLIACKLDK